MLPYREIGYILAVVLLAGCSAFPAQAPEALTQCSVPDFVESKAPDPKQAPVNPGTLAESVPAAEWQGNLKGHVLIPIDPASGQALADYEPISLGQSYSYAFSPDRSRLTAVGYVSPQHSHGGSLHLIDLEKWVDYVQELQLNAYVNAWVSVPMASIWPSPTEITTAKYSFSMWPNRLSNQKQPYCKPRWTFSFTK